jgi:hypothetical protein
MTNEDLFNSPMSTCPKCLDDFPTEDLNYDAEENIRFMLCSDCDAELDASVGRHPAGKGKQS